MTLKQSTTLVVLHVLFLSLLLRVSDSQSIVNAWNEVVSTATAIENYAPQPMRYVQALTHTAMYNAWVPFSSGREKSAYGVKEIASLEWKYRTKANKEEAVSYAAYYILKDLLPRRQSLFDALMDTFSYPLTPQSKAGKIGRTAAIRVLKARENDNSNAHGRLNPSGVPFAEPILLANYKPYKYILDDNDIAINFWHPLVVNGVRQNFSTPQFGLVTPFALKSGKQFRPKEGPIRSWEDEDGFKAQHRYIYDLSKQLTPKKRLMANFWHGANGINNPYPWSNITREISRRDRNNIDEDIKLFFVVANALLDGSIGGFSTKRYYNAVRPVTVIRKYFDPNWNTLFVTPPHPDYTAGHATTSTVAGVVLALMTGSDSYGGQFTDTKTGITLSWDTFTDAWKQAGRSRMYGGVHTKESVLAGWVEGQKVAYAVFRKAQALFQGRDDF